VKAVPSHTSAMSQCPPAARHIVAAADASHVAASQHPLVPSADEEPTEHEASAAS
jgi:hypothetical protein